MAQTDVSKNELMALLLGWAREPRETHRGKVVVRTVMQWHRGRYWTGATPDYTSWERFPEMQAYLQGLPDRDLQQVLGVVEDALVALGYGDYQVAYITPTILRDATVEVMG